MTAVDGEGESARARSPRVSVFGSGAGGKADLDRARRLGAALARAGYAVLNGGYGGTMEAAAIGAREAGGRAIGVTCAEFTFRSGPNPHLAEVIEAPTLFARLERLVRDGAAYVALPGGNGTLAEIAVAWECLRKGHRGAAAARRVERSVAGDLHGPRRRGLRGGWESISSRGWTTSKRRSRRSAGAFPRPGEAD